ncbi:MAG: hypothetical protein KC503_38240, partial [Myxococcales bacterium]|nr:hypothetical protein [Myxococcales bacterium]
MSDEVRAYEAANAYLNEGLIRLAASLAPRDSDALDGPHGAARLVGPQLSRRLRMLRFLPRLGHPERTFPAVHVGGTSGKGSTATLIAELLHAHGVGTGLHVTPYLQVCTEKLWARGRYASGRELASLVEWVRPHAEACRGADVPMHGMASVAITLEHYRREAVAVGVVEVGVGGHNDITNVLDTRVAVIGAVGLDHLKTLGPGIDDIAWHKAG